MWIPTEFIQGDSENMNENDKAAGFIDFFGNDEYPPEIGVQFSNMGEDIKTAEDQLDVINREDYDASTLHPRQQLQRSAAD